jgi:hypothetical protein
LSLDDISATLQTLAKKRGVTRDLLMRDVERAREKLHEEKHAKA